MDGKQPALHPLAIDVDTETRTVGSNEIPKTADGPASRRLRPSSPRTAQRDVAPPTNEGATAASLGWSGYGPGSWPERVLIVRLPIGANRLRGLIASQPPPPAPLPHPRQVAPPISSAQRDVNDQTFEEAMQDAFGPNHPHAGTLQSIDEFLQTDLTLQRMNREVIIVEHGGLEFRAPLRTLQHLVEQQRRARFQRAETRRREAGSAPLPPAFDDVRRRATWEALTGPGMLERGDDGDEATDGDEVVVGGSHGRI